MMIIIMTVDIQVINLDLLQLVHNYKPTDETTSQTCSQLQAYG